MSRDIWTFLDMSAKPVWSRGALALANHGPSALGSIPYRILWSSWCEADVKCGKVDNDRQRPPVLSVFAGLLTLLCFGMASRTMLLSRISPSAVKLKSLLVVVSFCCMAARVDKQLVTLCVASFFVVKLQIMVDHQLELSHQRRCFFLNKKIRERPTVSQSLVSSL